MTNIGRPLSQSFHLLRQAARKPCPPFPSQSIRHQIASVSHIRFFHSFSRLHTSQGTLSLQHPKPSYIGRIVRFLSIAIFFSTTGFVMAAIPAFKAANGILNPPTDAETLTLFTPDDDVTKEVEDFIQNHPMVLDLRSRPEFAESRPHLKMPAPMRSHSLTAGTLLGPGKVVVPPLAFNEEGGKSMVSISYLGKDLCGHPGIIHGGLLATMLDEGLARCCFAALPNKVGMTANLNINYKAPAPAGTFVILRAETTKVEGRKAWVKGHIETVVEMGETPVVLVEATALFIEPRQAAAMARAYPTS